MEETQNSPFTVKISDNPICPTDKIRFPTYDGRSDPRQYIIAFSIAMGQSHFTPDERDAGYCQLFVENLSGPTLSWFSRLETGSIDSYQQLLTAFLKHYPMYIKDGASEADLYCSNPPKGIKMVEIDKLEFSAKLLGIKESRRMLVLNHEKLNMHWRKIEVEK